MTYRQPSASPVGGEPVRTILVVAMPNSVHTARWLNMVRSPHLRFVLLPIYPSPLSPALRDWRHVLTGEDLAALGPEDVGVFEPPAELDAAAAETNARIGYRSWVPSFLPPNTPFAQPFHLMEAVRRFRPALVHSMEVQMAGYLCLATREHFAAEFPPWLLSNWGSDIFLYRKLDEHRPKLERLAQLIDAYLAECRRDSQIIRHMGFDGVVLPPIPASGGMSFDQLPAIEELTRPSTRRQILVKGYHGWSGRAMHILAALRMAAPSLRGYQIRVTLASPDVVTASRRLAEETGLAIFNDTYFPSHADVLERTSRSRMTIGFGISDGISTTLLEAMAMGSFPIQSDTSCGAEWIDNGRTGFLMSPHDITALAEAIRRAATDDALVDAAFPVNRATVEARWDSGVNGSIMIARYRALLDAFAARVNP